MRYHSFVIWQCSWKDNLYLYVWKDEECQEVAAQDERTGESQEGQEVAAPQEQEHSAYQFTYPCKFCSKEFSKLIFVQKHMKRKHK